MKQEKRLKNPVYTENLLLCSSILCGCIARVVKDNEELSDRLSKETDILPAYAALREAIVRITEDDSETVDANQLKLEL
jgi:hypothetical protein